MFYFFEVSFLFSNLSQIGSILYLPSIYFPSRNFNPTKNTLLSDAIWSTNSRSWSRWAFISAEPTLCLSQTVVIHLQKASDREYGTFFAETFIHRAVQRNLTYLCTLLHYLSFLLPCNSVFSLSYRAQHQWWLVRLRSLWTFKSAAHSLSKKTSLANTSFSSLYFESHLWRSFSVPLSFLDPPTIDHV